MADAPSAPSQQVRRWLEPPWQTHRPPPARRSCASDSTPGAGYRRFSGPAGGLELQGGGGDGLEGDRLGLDADRGWRGRRPGPPPRKVAPGSRSPAGRPEPARDSGPSVPRSGSAHRRGGPGGHAGAVPRRLRRPPCCDGRRRPPPASPRTSAARPGRGRSAVAAAPSAPGRRNSPRPGDASLGEGVVRGKSACAACAGPAAGWRQSSVISASRMTAASFPPNLVSNTVMPAKLYSGGASFISRCMVPVRFVASRM